MQGFCQALLAEEGGAFATKEQGLLWSGFAGRLHEMDSGLTKDLLLFTNYKHWGSFCIDTVDLVDAVNDTTIEFLPQEDISQSRRKSGHLRAAGQSEGTQ